ncbi:MAG: hypothetical protein RL021_1451 [Bacteroidota bacterium]
MVLRRASCGNSEKPKRFRPISYILAERYPNPLSQGPPILHFMAVTIQPVVTRKEFRTFVHFAELVPNGRKNWVPPIWADERLLFSEIKNPACSVARTEKWLAFKDGQLAGRIMGIIHDEYNNRKQEKSARFFALECINDREVAHRLLKQAETWARENGMNKIIGPFGFSDKDPEGVQVEGFDQLPVIATATNAPFLESLVVQEGYGKFVDCVVYRVPVPDALPEIYFRIAERIRSRNNLRPVSFTSRRSLKPYVKPVFRLINETYRDIYGFVPLSESEMNKLEAQYLPILNPKFVKMVLDELDRPVAFVIAVPDFSKGLQQARGRLFPFGFLKVFASMKKTKQLNLLLGAVLPDLQGKGITTMLATELLRDVRANGFTHMDSHLILETNQRMRAEVERIGGAVYKRYRIYEKKI